MGYSNQPNPLFFGAEVGALKVWTGSATTASGVATFDWSVAGFSGPPAVIPVASSPNTSTVTDRVWATMKTGWTATGGDAYALRGASVGIGGGDSVRNAPDGTTITVIAIGN